MIIEKKRARVPVWLPRDSFFESLAKAAEIGYAYIVENRIR